MGFKRGKLERCLFVNEWNETRVVSLVDDPLICAKPATLEEFWMQITKLVVIKRGKFPTPAFLWFTWDSSTKGHKKVNAYDSQWNLPTSTWTNAWTLLNCSTQRHWLALLTEQKGLNLQDETTVCDEFQHSLLLLGNCSTLLEWDQIWCSRQNACHTNLRHQHLQIWHVPRKRWDIWNEHVNWLSTWQYLHKSRMTSMRPWNTLRDILWPSDEEKNILHTVLR